MGRSSVVGHCRRWQASIHDASSIIGPDRDSDLPRGARELMRSSNQSRYDHQPLDENFKNL